MVAGFSLVRRVGPQVVTVQVGPFQVGLRTRFLLMGTFQVVIPQVGTFQMGPFQMGPQMLVRPFFLMRRQVGPFTLLIPTAAFPTQHLHQHHRRHPHVPTTAVATPTKIATPTATITTHTYLAHAPINTLRLGWCSDMS